ncbi:MAG: DUF748 domain-containing protein [Candidatus Omnitrophica bacterium]|nr:DUF748 domain-containing protein [Candidatus Omnitrophota bacterium]MCF7895267.1 DUF748 domain-containing protein [Candidatus Omnitrophota bacterium]
MKKIFIGILIFLVVIAILHIGLFAFINIKGKDITANKIEDYFGLRPGIGSLSLSFPFILEITDFDLGDLSFAKATISLGSFNPFKSSLRLNRVYFDKLNFKLVKEKEDFLIEPVYSAKAMSQPKVSKKKSSQESPSKGKTSKETKKEKKFLIKVKDFYFKNSTIRYMDKSSKPNIDLIFPDLNLTINNFSYPNFSKFNIKFISSVETKDKTLEELIKAEGWVDFINRNMDVTLEIDSFQYGAFSQYYPSIWQPQNLGLETATLSLNSKITAEENDLVIDNFLSLEEVNFIKLKEENKKELSRQRLIKTILGLLKKDNGKSQIHLKLKTKMDAPEINFSLLGKGLQESVPLGPKFITEQIFYKAGDIVKEGVGKAKNMPKETIEATVDAIEETIGKIKDIFTGSESNW